MCVKKGEASTANAECACSIHLLFPHICISEKLNDTHKKAAAHDVLERFTAKSFHVTPTHISKLSVSNAAAVLNRMSDLIFWVKLASICVFMCEGMQKCQSAS